ncbi:HlyD family secretion protein [Mucilaginibacter sp. X4EP1]|uniref:HlyD family secretion protein n=1 Tax=Mucilaginibacter sp. X4EP1 TaxID=2723092 RepID=UPI002169AA26|nr:HlyD family secretion protein [Mucilaginibacter sp. X4EP1]MCS3812875.1 HlyD family secretion protein [Mucilaginibacter sp. X4EP1]
MRLPIYSNDDISQNVISYRYRIKNKSKLIYTITLLTIIACLTCLPFIKVQISINAGGVFEPSTEKTELLAPVSGRIIKENLKDNQEVYTGDTLLIFDSSLPKKQNNLLDSQKRSLSALLHDATVLLSQKSYLDINLNLNTGQYQTSLQQLKQELDYSKLTKDQAEKTFKRFESLYSNKVLTDAEFEKYSLDYKQAVSSYNLIPTRYRSQWELDAKEYTKELKQLNGQQADLKDQSQKYVLKAPLHGSIQNLNGIQTGEFVIANQKIADISPDTKILAFCYIKPSDIGLIYKGQPVKFQVDAFNYNQWGLLDGKVLDISDDILLSADNQPVFKVKCIIDKSYLALKNGYRGYIKKGMSFTGRLKVTERTLYQLLYDQVDNWVNPNSKNN